MQKLLHIINSTFDYNQINPRSKLLDTIDADLSHDEYHTSLGDLTPEQILGISSNFAKVNLVIQGFDLESDIYKESQLLVDYLSGPATMPETFADYSKINERPQSPVLWVFGCSHSAGTGLLPHEKKYAEVLATHLGFPLKLVAQPGSSLHWSLRQIINARIKPKDIVVWQLTSPARTTVYRNHVLTEVQLANTADRFLLEVLTDDQLYFNHISLLNFGTQYLRSLGNRFVLVSIESQKFYYKYRSQYVRYPEYCYIPDVMKDFATDKMHMGPLSQQALAKCLLDRIYYLDE